MDKIGSESPGNTDKLGWVLIHRPTPIGGYDEPSDLIEKNEEKESLQKSGKRDVTSESESDIDKDSEKQKIKLETKTVNDA